MSLRFGVILLGAGASSRMGRPKLLLPWGATTVIGHLIQQWQRLGAGQIGVVTALDDPARAASRSASSPCEARAGRGPRRGETNKYEPPLPDPLLHPMEEREKSRSMAQPCNSALHAELDRLDFPREDRIVNPNPELGMFSSIQCAARWNGWLAELSHLVLALGDQPHLRQSTLQALLTFAASHPQKICQPLWNGRRRHPIVLPIEATARIGESPGPDLKAFLETVTLDRAFCEIHDPGLGLDIDLPSDYDRAIALFPPET